MVAASTAFEELASLLDEAQLPVCLRPERLASSVLHDATYHLIMVSYILIDVGGRNGDSPTMLASWLKLLQFAAARPELVDGLDDWLTRQRQRQPRLEDWPYLPRGYLADRTHDALVDYLGVIGAAYRSRDAVVLGPRPELLYELKSRVLEGDLFKHERTIIDRLAGHHVSKKALGAA